MLQFYLIQNHQTKPDYPEQINLEFVGEISYEVFERLQRKKVIDDRYSYYEDFRWSFPIIKQLSERIDYQKLKNDTDVIKLLKLLNKVDDNNSGLIAYCD